MTKFYWNKISYEILNSIKDKILDWKLDSWFFLLNWPENIWKKSYILNLISQLNILPQDLIVIEDPWKISWKNIQIKVDVQEKDQITKIWDKEFLNLWARQISAFLDTTPFWKYKLVFIENLERLNISASNALLKKLEEPWKNNFIFATSSNYNKILKTILSRAFIINFYVVNYEDFTHFLNDNNIILSEKKKKILYSISAWRIWLAKNLLQKDNNILDLIEEFINLEETTNEIFPKVELFKKILEMWKEYLFINWLIFYYSYLWKFNKLKKLIDIKQKSNSNVNLENLMFSYFIRC